MFSNPSVLLAAVLAGACGASDQPQSGRGGPLDDAGRSVTLERAPVRIVSLSPAITELLFALGAGDRVVGRTQWGKDPAEALMVPSVGDGLNPNVEVILAQRPDLVLFYASAANKSAIDRLEALGVATASIRIDRLTDLVRASRFLGDLLGARPVADSLTEEFQRRLDRVTVLTGRRPTVLIVAWDNPPIVIGESSFLSEIVHRAGGENVFGDEARPSLTVSLETIASRQPDIVFISGAEDPDFVRRPEWQTIRAIRERQFAVVEGTEFSYPSFRAPGAIRELRRALAGWQQ